MATSQEQEIYQLLNAKMGQLDLQKLLRPYFFQLAEQTKNSTDLALILYKNEVMSREDMDECIGESTTVYQNLEIYRVAKNENAGMQLLEALYETENFHIIRLLHQSSLLEQPDYMLVNQPWFRFKEISKVTPKVTAEFTADSYQALREKIRQVELKKLLGPSHIFELLEHTINPIELALMLFKKDVMSMQELKQCMNQLMILYQNLEVYRAVRAKNAGAPLIDALQQTGNFHIIDLLKSIFMVHTKERATVSRSTKSQMEDSQEQSNLQRSKAKTSQPSRFESNTWAKEAVDSTLKSYIQKMADLFEDPDDFYDAKNLETIHEGLKSDAMAKISSIYKQNHPDDPSSHLSHLEIQLLEAIANQFKTVQEINKLRDSYFNAKARAVLDEAHNLYARKMTDSFDIEDCLYKGRDKELSAREADAYEEAVNYLMENIPRNVSSNPQVIQELNKELTQSIKFWLRGQKGGFYMREYGHLIIYILTMMFLVCCDFKETRVLVIVLGTLYMIIVSVVIWLEPPSSAKKKQTMEPLVYPAMAFIYPCEGQATDNLSSKS